MNRLNAHLDDNHPAHKLVKEINERNEKLSGPYHEECGNFARYCACTGEKNVRKKYEQVR